MVIARLSVLAVAAVLAATGTLISARPATAAPVAASSLAWEQDPFDEGDPVTRGVLDGPSTRFQSLQDHDISRIEVTSASQSWSVALAPPTGEKLHPGVYRDAERANFRHGRAPGLDVSHASTGCNTVYGEFAIHQIVYDSSGAVSMLEASLVQRCEQPNSPALRVQLRYRATLLSYEYQLDDEQPGTAPSHTYRGATSTFSVQSLAFGGLRFAASGDRQYDIVEFYPPQGEQLKAGTTYTGVQSERAQEPGHAAMTVVRFDCSPLTGTFTINELTYSNTGEPNAMSATFAIQCPHIPRTLTGSIHFNA